MNFRLLLLLACVAAIVASSCEKPRVFVEEGSLNFSVDTVKFDSIFTTFPAPTGRVVVTNNTNENIMISRIWLPSSPETEFQMIIDGRKTEDATEFPLAKGDSLHVFVTFKSELRDMYAEEFINFQVGGNTQQVLVRAKVIDAYMFRIRREDSVFVIPVTPTTQPDTTWTPEKFIIVDGPLYVPEGRTLNIAAGTRVFFTPFKDDNFNLFSMLLIDGTLNIQGTPDNPVIMEGTRFDSLYMENPAQWRGIRFLRNSVNSTVEHALIKNGLIGLRIDSTSNNGNPKVTVKHTEIRNMGAFGVWGLGFAPSVGMVPALVMENSLIHNCKDRTLILSGGGNYEFRNVTFANYSFDFSRRQPQVFINNYLTDGNSILGTYDLKATFLNTAFWGTEEEELLIDSVAGPSFDLNFDHCLVRTSTDPDRDYDYGPYFNNTIENQDPLFNDPRGFDYRPKEGSPLIEAGLDLSIYFTVDIRDDEANFPRDKADFTIGAYEYYPIEE